MLDFNLTKIEALSAHRVENKQRSGELLLTNNPIDIDDDWMHDLLTSYFFQPFREPEFFEFSFSNGDPQMNPLFQYCKSIFSDAAVLHAKSRDIASLLYEVSEHPQIKAGDLFVCKLSNILVGEKMEDAIGIFKAEAKYSFIKVKPGKEGYQLDYEDGINIDKLDKGCIIFNCNSETGYKICVVDKSSKSGEAIYWNERFLNVKACSDEYHFTKDIMNATTSFVNNQLSDEFLVTKTDKIDLLNRSVEYFKTRDNFERVTFEEEVLYDEDLIKSFRSFNEVYEDRNEVQLADSFEISNAAVKKSAKDFKSVLKLDKNFSLYIHGDRSKIQQGVEADGRKFYKLYFDELR